jgi:hypothetical protein
MYIYIYSLKYLFFNRINHMSLFNLLRYLFNHIRWLFSSSRKLFGIGKNSIFLWSNNRIAFFINFVLFLSKLLDILISAFILLTQYNFYFMQNLFNLQRYIFPICLINLKFALLKLTPMILNISFFLNQI